MQTMTALVDTKYFINSLQCSGAAGMNQITMCTDQLAEQLQQAAYMQRTKIFRDSKMTI